MAQFKINIRLLITIIVLLGVSYISLSISIFSEKSVYEKADKGYVQLINQKTANIKSLNSTDYNEISNCELDLLYKNRLQLCQTQLKMDMQHNLIFIIGISLASLVVGILIGLLILLIKFGGY